MRVMEAALVNGAGLVGRTLGGLPVEVALPFISPTYTPTWNRIANPTHIRYRYRYSYPYPYLYRHT